MNQEESSLQVESGLAEDRAPSRLTAALRDMMIGVLERASEGHFLLRERGRVIAEVGDRSASLQAEVNIIDPRCYLRALVGGDTGAGEAFVEGWWTTPDITAVTQFFARNLAMMDHWCMRFGWMLKPLSLLRALSRLNSTRQARRNIIAHYDLGDELYRSFLDPRMQYSSALYEGSDGSLAGAQENKLARICSALQLSEADHLLEVGSGWGGLAIYAAQHHGCRVTTTTISDAQLDHVRTRVSEAGLGNRIEVLNRDYRQLEGRYDKIVSVEMVEAVGRGYLPTYFSKLNSLLRPGGLFMLQAITIADQRYAAYKNGEDFIQKHVFPGGFLPSLDLMSRIVARKTDLIIRDVLDIGCDYARTLADWRHNFEASCAELANEGYDERFCRLWTYYLGYCEGGFRERRISAVQLLASKAPHR